MRMQAVGTRNHEQQSATGHAHAHQCWASALSGIPAREPLFNGSICRPASLALFQSALARSRSLAGAVKVWRTAHACSIIILRRSGTLAGLCGDEGLCVPNCMLKQQD